MNGQISDRGAYKRLLAREPVWQISSRESMMFYPSVIPDSVARGFVIAAGSSEDAPKGGKDMFGIEWIYDSAIKGSMVRPGNPLLTDANEWYERVVWPDVDSWAWDKSAKENECFFNADKFTVMPLMTGWFERLVSMMDFAGASIALIDDEQKAAVKDFFSSLTDLYIRILGRVIETFPLIDGFWIHDDWGGQKTTFFSPETCGEMIVPHMRRLTDYLHSRGKYCDFHSCGILSLQVPNMIAAGWDSWSPQNINNSIELYERFGDKIIIGVTYDWPAPESDSEEQSRAVDAFVSRFCIPGKPCILSDWGQTGLTETMRSELISKSMISFAARV